MVVVSSTYFSWCRKYKSKMRELQFPKTHSGSVREIFISWSFCDSAWAGQERSSIMNDPIIPHNLSCGGKTEQLCNPNPPHVFNGECIKSPAYKNQFFPTESFFFLLSYFRKSTVFCPYFHTLKSLICASLVEGHMDPFAFSPNVNTLFIFLLSR